MSVQQTIESLYQEIKLIREFICEEENESILLGSDSFIAAKTFILPLNTRYIIVTSFTSRYISTIFDRLNSIYNEYNFLGFGSIRFQKVQGGIALSSITRLDASIRLIEVPKEFTGVHVNPSLFCTGNIQFFGKSLA